MLYHKVPPSWGLPHILELFDFPTENQRKAGKSSLRVEGISPFLMECDPQSLLASVNPATLRPSPSSALIFAVLSTGVQTSLCLEEEEGGWGSGKKRTLPFSWPGLITIQLRTSIWVEAAGSDTRFQRFRFPGLLKRSDEKRVEAGVKSLWLCRAEAGELCLRGPFPTQEVLC